MPEYECSRLRQTLVFDKSPGMLRRAGLEIDDYEPLLFPYFECFFSRVIIGANPLRSSLCRFTCIFFWALISVHYAFLRVNFLPLPFFFIIF